jgi:ATP-dependent DNA ligase
MPSSTSAKARSSSPKKIPSRPSSRTKLPIQVPFPPMEALAATEVPQGPQWQYEPKWDGFRCLVFKEGSSVMLQSKAGQPLARYFPELVEFFEKTAMSQYVVDGEIVIPVAEGLSFDDLLMRIHPAESRIRKLAQQTPALFIAFDMLVDTEGRSLIEEPLARRREALEKFVNSRRSAESSLRLSPMTLEYREAVNWYRGMSGLDGIIAKRREVVYESGKRTGAMQKIKRLRTADCVVGGFRYASKGKEVGSLLLGLYDADGLLNHVGFTSSIAHADRKALTAKLEKLVEPPGFTGRAPGGPSRWNNGRSAEWQPLKPSLVAEVQFDHFSGERFRHGTKFLRWRPDKSPQQCSIKQVVSENRSSLKLL